MKIGKVRGAGARAWGLGVVASFLVGVGPACTEDVHSSCGRYECRNEARLEGEVALPEETGGVTVKYCSELDCVEGALDVSKVGLGRTCVGPCPTDVYNDVCFMRDAAGRLKVEAFIVRADDMTLPDDGEHYTLTIVEGATGETLFEETREAAYETTRHDDCHLCWQAEMSL